MPSRHPGAGTRNAGTRNAGPRNTGPHPRRSLRGRRPPVSDPSHTISSTPLQRGVLGGCSSRDRGGSRRSGSAAPAQICPTGGSHWPRCLGSTAPTGCRHRFCGEVTGDVVTLEAIWVRAGYSHPSRSQEISRRDWGYCGRQPAPENSATQWRMPIACVKLERRWAPFSFRSPFA